MLWAAPCDRAPTRRPFSFKTGPSAVNCRPRYDACQLVAILVGGGGNHFALYFSPTCPCVALAVPTSDRVPMPAFAIFLRRLFFFLLGRNVFQGRFPFLTRTGLLLPRRSTQSTNKQTEKINK
nr:hypothetical protein [Pandoravirus massiliensis]